MYRAEHNKITNVWADIDKEGLGNKKGATLDDVLVSDVFDRALDLARKGGAQGALDPLVRARACERASERACAAPGLRALPACRACLCFKQSATVLAF